MTWKPKPRRPKPRYRCEVVIIADECDVIELGERPAVGLATEASIVDTMLPHLYAEKLGGIWR